MSVHRNLKGQGAMEYLMTYSWAILVVAIVGMVLWQIGVFDTHEAAIPTEWSTLKPMPPTIAYSAAGNSFEAGFINVAGSPIRITYAGIDETISGGACTNVAVEGVSMPGDVTVKAGEEFKVTADCPAKDKKDPYDMVIAIKYIAYLPDSTTHHVETGHIKGMVED
jgi:hypothetical protein